MERGLAAAIRDVVIVVPEQRQTFPRPWFRTLLVRNYADLGIADVQRRAYRERADVCILSASQYLDNGAFLVLDIIRSIARSRPSVRFVAFDRFADVEVRRKVLSALDDPGISARYALLPEVSPAEVHRVLDEVTIGLALDLPTRRRIHALPVKLFEYMAAGLPIVASDLPKSRQVLVDAHCGLLVEPGLVRGYVDAICSLVDDRATAERMGRRGQDAFRDRYNWQSEVKSLLRVYRRALKMPEV